MKAEDAGKMAGIFVHCGRTTGLTKDEGNDTYIVVNDVGRDDCVERCEKVI